jgi:hypothetical protein
MSRWCRVSRRPEYSLETAFEWEVRRVPAESLADLIRWLHGWRQRPGRVFWVMDEAGQWQRL